MGLQKKIRPFYVHICSMPPQNTYIFSNWRFLEQGHYDHTQRVFKVLKFWNHESCCWQWLHDDGKPL